MNKIFPLVKIAFVIIAGLIFFSCSGKTVDEKTFVAVYCDLTIAHDTLDAGAFKKEKQSILNKYSVTEQQLSATYNEYYQTPKKWESFFEKSLARMEKMRKNQPI
jgi:hypothetical protein